MFTSHHIDVVIEKQIKLFGHATAGWYPLSRLPQMLRDFAYIFSSAVATYKLIKRERPALVHLSSAHLLGPAFGAKIAQVPIVWHIRECLVDGYFGIRKLIISHLFDYLSDAIIAITQREARRLKPSKKVVVIYDPVEFDYFNKDIPGNIFRDEFKLTDADRCVAMFGGVTPIKGTLQFVEAACEILITQKQVKFFVFGSIYNTPVRTSAGKLKRMITGLLRKETYQEKIQKILTKNGRDQEVIFVGYRRDIPFIMAGLDVIVFPSTVPHAALPIMEAGAMAKPVVASDWGRPGEPDESVIDGITGFLVPPGNSDALAKAISKILICPGLAKRMGEAGYMRVKKLCGARENVAKVMELYETISGV